MSFVYRDPGYEGNDYDGGYGTHEGAMHNPWIQYEKSHGHEGYTKKQLSNMYKRGGAPLGGESMGGYVLGGAGTKAGAKHNPWIQFLKKHKNSGLSMQELRKMYSSGCGNARVDLQNKIKKAGAKKGRVLASYKLLTGTKKGQKAGKKDSALLKDPELMNLIHDAVSKAEKLTPAKLRNLIHGGMMSGGFSFSDIFDVVKTVAPLALPLLL